MQEKFKPRIDDLERVDKIKKEAKPSTFGGKITVTKEDWDFIVRIARQHARISEATLAALEKHSNDTAMLQRCQALYTAVASEVASIKHYGDRSKLKHAVQDVLKDVVDSRVVSWAIDDMLEHKPSSLDEILEAREAKIAQKHSLAKKLKNYNQPNPTPQKKVKQKSQEASI